MQRLPKRSPFASRPEGSNTNVTTAVGMQETAGHLRARRSSLFARTVLWITALVCIAFLLGTFAQAWSNSHLNEQVQIEQQHLQDLRSKHDQLQREAAHFKDPSVIESEARQQLNYVRGDEHLVIVTQPQSSPIHPTSTLKQSAQQQSYWQDWWHIFFHS